MAQPSKRNAGQAFEGQSNDSKSNKRVRQEKSIDTPKKHKSKKTDPTKHDDGAQTASSVSVKDSKKKDSTSSKSKRLSQPNGDTPAKSSPGPDPTSLTNTDHVPKLSKKEKKQKRQNLEQSEIQPDSNAVVAIAGEKSKNKKNKHKQKEKQKKTHQVDKDAWRLSKAIGGTFTSQDPILTPDGQYLILVTRREVQIYSTATSLLVRSVISPEVSPICSCTLSTSSQDELFVGSKRGLISKFNWKTGKLVGQWQTELKLAHLAFAHATKKQEVLFAISPSAGSSSCLALVSLEKGNKQASLKALLRQESLLNFIEFTDDLSTIVVASKDEVHIGTLAQDVEADDGLNSYDWKSIQMKGQISSCDVRVASVPAAPKLPVVNIVVGLQNGVMMVYRNLLNQLVAIEKGQKQRQLGQRLHWHRTVVRSVKWSRDGNYLVSGGDESVLVLWQLDTHQKQYLPHLSTSILNITVSKSGAHYALRLGDNSVMVLSTADLAPSTNVTGLSLPSDRVLSDSILLHPSEPKKMLVATSIRSVGPGARSEATHLQTYDIENNIQLSRQALTRNLVTAVNIGPNGQSLREPDVTQVQLSCDARWLATVDEWSPDEVDVEALYLKEDTTREHVRESTLRFWCWKPDEDSWEPTTRIDEPHGKGHTSILSVVPNPISLEFASLGSDGHVRVWTPKARLRDGVVVKDRNGTPLFNWSCSRAVQIGAGTAGSQPDCHGSLAYSGDGSVLAVTYSVTAERQHVHLIDVGAGNIVLSQPDIVSGARSRLGFCGRYLVAVSDAIVVFDTITYQTTFRLQLEAKFTSRRDGQSIFLAINSQSNIFAVGTNAGRESNAGLVAIFNVDQLEKAAVQNIKISGQIRALLVDPISRGLVVVDGDSVIHKISPPTSQAAEAAALVPYTENKTLVSRAKGGFESMFGHGAETVLPGQSQLLLADAARPAQSLDDLLSTPAVTAQLGVQELFERVARAVSGVAVGA